MEDYLVLDSKIHRAWSSPPHMAHPPAGDILKGQTSSLSEHSLPSLTLWLTQLTAAETGPGGHKHKLCGRQRQVPFTGKAGSKLQLCYEALITQGRREASPPWKEPFPILESSTTAMMSWYDYVRHDIWPGLRNYVYWRCIHGINMRALSPSKRQLGASMYLPCIFDWFHLFTQLWLTFWLSSCKQTIWKIWVETGKLQFAKIIAHLNWSRSLINVVPIQTESCLNITTFVDIKNHVSEDFYVIGWTQWLFWFIVISCFFSSLLMELIVVIV